MKPSSSPGFQSGSTTDRRYFSGEIALDDVCQHPLLMAVCERLIGHALKLRSILGRTLRAVQAKLCTNNIASDSADAPVVGFILMLDAFTPANGATRFIPKSQGWPDLDPDRLEDPRLDCKGEVLACGAAGSNRLSSTHRCGTAIRRTLHRRRDALFRATLAGVTKSRLTVLVGFTSKREVVAAALVVGSVSCLPMTVELAASPLQSGVTRDLSLSQATIMSRCSIGSWRFPIQSELSACCIGSHNIALKHGRSPEDWQWRSILCSQEPSLKGVR